MEKKENQNTLAKMYLIGLFAVFFGPLFFAMWLFYGPSAWVSSSSSNHGNLIQPAYPLNEFSLKNVKGDSWTHEDFHGKWTMLYLGDSKCDLYCEANLFKMRQVRLTLGRDSNRVQRKYLGIYSSTNTEAINTIFKNYPDMHVEWFKPSVVEKTIPYFYELEMHQIYLIDPLGNVMMFYPKDATAKGMKKDLKRLLKVSKIG